tara:strand:+ start:240 stop:983 length:744 start_codon:yes stop_codon:yes gene_type:complete
MQLFGNLKDIKPELEKTWRGRVFLTFDIDWAHDHVLNDTLDLVQKANVSTTWFVTHSTPFITRLRLNPTVELGVHPNFNFLLDGKVNDIRADSPRCVHDIMDDIKGIVPEAKSLRSHSLTQSERLVDSFRDFGITHLSNTFLPHGAGLKTKPFDLWDETIVVPHCWQDNVSLRMSLNFPNIGESSLELIVINFHPIHIFLNTENLERYENTRNMHHDPEQLIKLRNKGYGIRSQFIELLSLSQKNLS